jgi:hypothetical protein
MITSKQRKSGGVPLDAIVLAAFVVGVAFLFGTNGGLYSDGDSSWHIATGQWIMANGRVPMQDPFSYTAFGKPWIAHEWLSALIMALAYQALGFTGISLLMSAALGLTFLIIGLRLRQWASPVELAVVLTLVAVVLQPLMVARPMVMVWPLLALWTEAMLRARDQDRVPSLWLVPLMTVWINLHASFAVGLGLTGLFTLEALIESTDKRRAFFRWCVFGLACTAAALINPHGLTGLLMPLGAFTSPTIGLIYEFKPTDFTKMPNFEAALMAIIAVGLWRGARIAPVRLFLLLAMLHLALAHMRHQALFIIIAGLVAAPALTSAWIEGRTPNPPLGVILPRRERSWFLGGALAVLGLIAIFRFPVVPPESDVNPVHAFAALSPALKSQRVFNDYSLGGPLILRGVHVYMDGRTDVYGDAHFAAYQRAWDGDAGAFAAAYRKWRFCWTIFPPENRRLLRLLDGSPKWKRIYADKFAVVHVRGRCAG